MGLMLSSYSFDKYRSKKPEHAPSKVTFVVKDADRAEKAFKNLEAAVAGVFLAKDLANLPPNDLYPDSYAKIIRSELSGLGVKITVMDEKQLKAKGFGAHLAVGQGSARPPRVVVMECVLRARRRYECG